MDTRRAVKGELVPAAPPKDGRRYGSDLIVDLLHQYDLPFIALNPGASFRGLHDSLVNYGGNRPENTSLAVLIYRRVVQDIGERA